MPVQVQLAVEHAGSEADLHTALAGKHVYLFPGMRKHGDLLLRLMAAEMGLDAPEDTTGKGHPDGRGEKQKGLRYSKTGTNATWRPEDHNADVTNPLPVVQVRRL